MAMEPKEELKVDTELADEVDQSGFQYTYAFDSTQGSYVTPGGMVVDAQQGFKSSTIPYTNLFSFERPHMRGFHYSWMSFFMAFVCWFAFAPLMPLVKETLGLTLQQVITINIASVASTVAARFIMGPLCDQWGPKRCQFLLLSWIAIMVLFAPLVNNLASVAMVRFLIGFGGATFVVTQYWSTMLFTKEIVGRANATTAGWGNLGGGAANNIMIGIYSMFLNSGYSVEKSWRLSFFIPAFIVGTFAILLRTTSDDSPLGDYVPLMKAGTIEKKTANQSFRGGFFNLNNWVLGVQYAACFGVELHVNNTAPIYFKNVFGLSAIAAANYASIFGWMNICCRTMGGALSDHVSKSMGMQGRLIVQTLGLVLEGFFLIIFSRQTTIPSALCLLVLFSACVQATEGMTFGIVPYVDPKNTGAVCGVVGAWGNIGAVCWGMLFKYGYAQAGGSIDLQGAFMGLGFIIMCTGIFSFAVKIHGHSSLTSSEEYGGYCTEEYIQSQNDRIQALEEKTTELAAKVEKTEKAITGREA